VLSLFFTNKYYNKRKKEGNKNYVKKIKLTLIPLTVVEIRTCKEYDGLMRLYKEVGWKSEEEIPSSHKLYTRNLYFTIGKVNQNKRKKEVFFKEVSKEWCTSLSWNIITFQEFLALQDLAVKVNTYHNGKVKSLSADSKATVGLMLKRKENYNFTAGKLGERITLLTRGAKVITPKEGVFKVLKGGIFIVRPFETFYILCNGPTHYLCEYIKPKKK
jgi:uncharacterized protein YaiE (UPF0345 family)